MTLLDVANLLQFATAGTAIALAWKRRSYRPVALLFAVVTLADWIRLWIDRGILSDTPRPYTGAARAGYHAEQALFLTWPAGLAAVAGWVFHGRRPWGVAIAYGAVLASLALGYPQIRQGSLATAYLAIHIVAFGYALTCIVQRLLKATIEIEQIAVTFSTVISLAALLGPYTGHDWTVRWRFAQFANVVLYAILTYRQGVLLWNPSRSSS